MARIQPIDPENTSGKTKEILDALDADFGIVPNIFKTMANSPSTLLAYHSMLDALEDASIGPVIREKISLAISEKNHCQYCTAAHVVMAKDLGIDDVDIQKARLGEGSTDRENAILELALAIMDNHGLIRHNEIENARNNAISDAEICEIVAVVAKSMFANYFNHVAQTDIDFPEAPVIHRPPPI